MEYDRDLSRPSGQKAQTVGFFFVLEDRFWVLFILLNLWD